jgi:hypothetical protein
MIAARPTAPRPTTTHPIGPRLVTAALALGGAATLGLVATVAGMDTSSPAAIAGHSSWAIPGLLALAGLALLALALAIPQPAPILYSLGALGAAFLVGLPASGPWRSLTPFAGGWLLAVAELAYWSVDFKVASRDGRHIYVRRAATIAALVAGGIALAVVPEIGVDPGPLTGLELTATGLLGGAALIAVAAGLAWRLRPAAVGRGASNSAAEPD